MGDLKGALPRIVLRLNWPLAKLHLTGLLGAVGQQNHLESSDLSFGGEREQRTWDWGQSDLEAGLGQMAHLATGTPGPGLPGGATRRGARSCPPLPQPSFPKALRQGPRHGGQRPSAGGQDPGRGEARAAREESQAAWRSGPAGRPRRVSGSGEITGPRWAFPGCRTARGLCPGHTEGGMGVEWGTISTRARSHTVLS